jgi:Flp pilus assembly protein TadB
MSNSSSKDRMVQSAAGAVVHPDRYRKQFWTAGVLVVLAAVIYLLFGLLALVVVAVIGGVGTRYALKSRRSRQERLP